MIKTGQPWRRFGAPGNRVVRFVRSWLINIRPVDRLVILVLAVILVINLAIWQIKIGRTEYVDQPVPGGGFTEAILAANQAEVDKQLARLTHAGLLRFNENHEIQPSIATSWQISSDGRQYELTLQDRYDSQTIRDLLLTQRNGFSDVTIEAPEPRKLVIKLVQPFGPFLEELTKPNLPYGPFVVKKRNSRELVLERNGAAALPESHLERMIVAVYHDQPEYQRAFEDHAAMGFANVKNGRSRYQHYELVLPREIVLFFNLDRKDKFPKDLRRKLKAGEPVSGINLVITTTNSEATQQAGQRLKKQFEQQGATVELRSLELSQIEKEIIPKRDYDLLLFGLDFGADPDPYPFWHSSQIGGKGRNLAQFVNKEADKLLEQARLTTDPKQRQDKYSAFQKILDEEVPALPLGKQVVDYQLSKKVKGVKVGQGVTVSDRFQNINEWHLKTKRVRKK